MIPYQPQLLTVDDGRWRPNAEIAPNCPRCDSPNAKFCYYNNYSLSQPRYFCKACRRYWTKGGALRNVPVGGGCRKKRKSAKSQRQGTANSRQIAHGQPLNSLRPDLILDGMALGHHPSSSASDSSASDVSGIDMAEMYAKYVNPTTGKRHSFVAETLATTDQQADLSTRELELLALPLIVDGAHSTDHFFGSSNCTADSALTWPGPGEEFGIVDSLISYQNVIGSDWDNCNQFSSLDAMYQA